MRFEGRVLILALAALAAAVTPVVSHAAPFAYVLNTGDGTISVIDTATDTVSATIDATAVGVSGWGGVAIHPNNPRLYFTADNFNVGIVNTSTNTVIGTIGLDWYPTRLAVNRAGTRLYAAKRGGDFAVIDLTTNTVLELHAGNGQRGIVALPNGSAIYGTQDFGGSLFGTSSTPPYTAFTPLSIVNYTREIAASPDSAKVYVTTQPSGSGVAGTLKVATLSTGSVTASHAIGTSPGGVAVSPTGDRVYVASMDPATTVTTNLAWLTILNGATDTLITTINAGRLPMGVGVNPSGSKVYVVNSCSSAETGNCYISALPGSVTVVDTATNAVITTIQVGNQPAAYGEFLPPACAGCCG